MLFGWYSATGGPGAGRLRAAVAAWVVIGAWAVIGASARPATATPTSPIDLERYARLLASATRETSSLSGTTVDYAALASSSDLDALVAQIAAARPSTLDRESRLAFWINSYNLLTLDLVRRHHPVAGIRDIGSLLRPVWKIPVATIEGRELSLDAIEHAILRPLGEPRIHAAIVCASKSCPPLRRTPFRPESLDADLDEAARRWLANPRKGIALDRAGKTIRLSRIFDWFEEDFEAGGGALAFVARFVPPADAEWLRGPGRSAAIEYFDYDWSLNDR